jgi:hypothetical protein
MDPIAVFGATYTSIKALSEVLIGLTKLNLDAEVNRKVFDALRQATDVQQQLFEAQSGLLTLQSENESLRRQIQTYDDWESTKREYRLIQTARGATVYQSVNSAPMHHACPSCFTKKVIQIIQDVPGDTFDRSQCPGCHEYYAIKPESPVSETGMVHDYDPFDPRR